MGKTVRTLVRGRHRRLGGLSFYEVGQFNFKQQAQHHAQKAREQGYNARVVNVKSAKLVRDKKNYPWHLFVHGGRRENR